MTPLELNTLGIEMALEGLEIRQLGRCDALRRRSATLRAEPVPVSVLRTAATNAGDLK